MIALKIPPAHVRLMSSTKNRFCSVLAMSRSRPRFGNNDIGNLLPLEMCLALPKNQHLNKPVLVGVGVVILEFIVLNNNYCWPP